MKKGIWWIIGVAVLAVAAGGILVRGRAARLAAADAAGLVTVAVGRADLSDTITGSGTVVAAEERPVYAGVSGTVSAVLGAEGQAVAAGDPVLQLENDAVHDQLAAARLDVDLAELKWHDAVAPGNAAVASARRRVEAARLTVAQRSADVDGLQVLAPVSGRATAVAAEVGAEVRSGQVLLAILADGPPVVTAQVPATQARFVIPGQTAEVAIHGLPSLRGQVADVAAEARSAGGAQATVDVTVRLDLAQDLRPGMTGAVRIRTAGPGAPDAVEAAGSVAAPARIDVAAAVSGRVTRVAAAEGAGVGAGDLLVQLENQTLAHQLAQAESDLAEAEANLANTLEPLADNRGQSNARSLQLQLEKARLTLAARQRDMERLTVRAPVGGVLLELPGAGHEVGTNSLVFRVSRQSELEITFDVDELDIRRVQVGMPAAITADALPGESFAGTVGAIAPKGTVKDGVAYFAVRVTVAAPGALRPGMTAEVAIPVAERQAVLVVPAQALSDADGQTTVRRLDGGGQVTRVPVQVGLNTGLQAEIRSGLQAGDRVVIGQIEARRGPAFGPQSGGEGNGPLGGVRP